MVDRVRDDGERFGKSRQGKFERVEAQCSPTVTDCAAACACVRVFDVCVFPPDVRAPSLYWLGQSTPANHLLFSPSLDARVKSVPRGSSSPPRISPPSAVSENGHFLFSLSALTLTAGEEHPLSYILNPRDHQTRETQPRIRSLDACVYGVRCGLGAGVGAGMGTVAPCARRGQASQKPNGRVRLPLPRSPSERTEKQEADVAEHVWIRSDWEEGFGGGDLVVDGWMDGFGRLWRSHEARYGIAFTGWRVGCWRFVRCCYSVDGSACSCALLIARGHVCGQELIGPIVYLLVLQGLCKGRLVGLGPHTTGLGKKGLAGWLDGRTRAPVDGAVSAVDDATATGHTDTRDTGAKGGMDERMEMVRWQVDEWG